MPPPAEADLLDALAARSGLVCAVGAGGKKTTLYRIAAEHPGRVGLTSTVYTPVFPADLPARQVVAAPAELLEAVAAAAAQSRCVAFAHPSEKRARLAGLAPDEVARVHRAVGFDLTLVKADGARSRWIKAPADDEPVIPSEATTVLPIVSARCLGVPLSDEIGHRVERLEALMGARIGQPVLPEHVAHLLAHPRGALRGVGAAEVIPILNMVEGEPVHAAARRAAELALTLTDRFDRVVLAAMRRTAPLVEIVTR